MSLQKHIEIDFEFKSKKQFQKNLDKHFMKLYNILYIWFIITNIKYLYNSISALSADTIPKQ